MEKNRLIVKQFQTVTNLELRLVAMLPVNLFSIPLGIEHIFSFSIPLGIEHNFKFDQTWIQNCFVQNWIESGPDYFQMLSIYFISIAIILFLKGHYSSFEHNNFFGPRLVFLKVFEEDGTGKLLTTGKGLLRLRCTVIYVKFGKLRCASNVVCRDPTELRPSPINISKYYNLLLSYVYY